MKILYGVQLTGNGHINRSLILISRLRELGHDVEIMTSGFGSNLEIKSDYHYRGFTFGYSNGSISWIRTVLKSNPLRLILDIFDNKRKWDLVISDFEPVSAWKAKVFGVKSISISNQNTAIIDKTPGGISKLFMKWFCPTKMRIGFCYTKSNSIFLPIVDDSIKNVASDGSIVVYLPYKNQNNVLGILMESGLKFMFYTSGNLVSTDSVIVKKISKSEFQEDLSKCSGVITHSGFSTTSEALVLRKKLWSIPIRGQWEQEQNAKKLDKLGVFTEHLSVENFKKWNEYEQVNFQWESPVEDIIKKIIEIYEKD